jgi:hypothetical protein
MFARLVRAPVAGEVVSVGGGQVMLRTGLRRVEVRAGFNGKVSEVLPEMGVVIETSGALIQGVWGNGQVDSGMLLAVARTPDEELTRPSIDVSMRGAVVLAGHCSNADALRVGAELPLRGLILASMTADLAPLARSLPYPIFVLEGFGKIPMNETAYTLLTTNEKREVSINTVYDPAAGERPEVIIPLDAVGHTSPETIEFAAGQKVRVQGWPYTGRVGTINLVLNGLTALPNGLRVPAADVQLDPETKITVPLANLEVLV